MIRPLWRQICSCRFRFTNLFLHAKHSLEHDIGIKNNLRLGRILKRDGPRDLVLADSDLISAIILSNSSLSVRVWNSSVTL
jgi:hypothetical protein